eukprot:5732817-Pleurochrysis_carterae.AAC.2
MRSNSPGRDFYGRLTVEVWFSISEKHRRRIVAILLVNNLAQFANQVRAPRVPQNTRGIRICALVRVSMRWHTSPGAL